MKPTTRIVGSTSENADFSIRPVLREFAILMEEKLRKNDHKTGWRDLPVEALFRFLMIEIEEFKTALEFLPVEQARRELVDCANYCLILHDRLGMLKQDKSMHAQGNINVDKNA